MDSSSTQRHVGIENFKGVEIPPKQGVESVWTVIILHYRKGLWVFSKSLGDGTYINRRQSVNGNYSGGKKKKKLEKVGWFCFFLVIR